MTDVGFDEALTFTRASTGTYYDAQGVLQTAAVDDKRLTHDPETGEALGLLIEEQRTNLLLWSEAFDDAEWVKDDVTVTAVTDGYSIIEGTGTQRHGVNEQRPALSGPVAGVFVVKYSGRHFQIATGDHGGQSYANFDLQNGVVSAQGGDYTGKIKLLSNGFYECSVVGPNASAASPYGFYGQLITDPVNSGFLESYTGDGVSGVIAKRAQLEAGAFPTSYIKTEDSLVTRAADNASVDTLKPWFDVSGHTWFCDFIFLGAANFSAVIGSNQNNLNPLYIGDLIGGFGVDFRDSGDSEARFSGVIPEAGNRYKVAVSVTESGKIIMAVDGNIEIDTQGSALTFSTNETYRILQRAFIRRTTAVMSSTTNIPGALSAIELKAITS